MTEYEILLLLDAELPEERQEEIVSRARESIERGGGQFAAHDVWGRRKLAYEIDRKAEGSYHLLSFSAEPETLAEVSRVLKITDGVLRHLAVRKPAGKRPVPATGTGEGARGDREVSPATAEAEAAPPPAEVPEEAVSAGRPDE